MRIWIVVLAFALNVAAFTGLADAHESSRRSGEQARSHAQGDRLHHMQQLRRKHDLRHTYHDRRPRRPMRSR